MIETCASCGTDYAVTPRNAGIVVYLTYLPASHVLATCTSCQNLEVIYCTPRSLADLTKVERLSVDLQTEPTPERREAADATWARHRAADRTPAAPPPEVSAPVGVLPELPQLPRDWRRQLHDDLRAFGRGVQA